MESLNSNTINWGIIGCGDVTEVKSGPAFNKVPNSSLIAVMRRDGAKAKDYAQRHGVPKWYDDAHSLIHDPEVNAIYIATPPQSHEQYAIAALDAGKPVYVEKPVALTEASCQRMQDRSASLNGKVSIAHYRRALPLFMKVKELLEEKAIGDLRFVDVQLCQTPRSNIIARTDVNWRLDPAISGGGLFHDLSPHQLDLMLHYFGKVKNGSGFSLNQGSAYEADDIVCGQLLFESGLVFKGLWCFTVGPDAVRDHCEIAGTAGTMTFSFFGPDFTLVLTRNGTKESFTFQNPPNIQQPMIEKVVNYFLDRGPNPCSAAEACEVMHVIDRFTDHSVDAW